MNGTDQGDPMKTIMKTIQAIAVSPGIAIGRVMQIRENSRFQEPELVRILPEDTDKEIARFHTSLENARSQLAELQKEVRQKLNTTGADIFEAHLLILEDKTLVNEVEKQIRTGLCSSEYAVFLAVEKFAAVFGAMKDEYLRERATDIRDVASRVLDCLGNIRREGISIEDRRIIIANTLTPSETARLNPKNVLGFASETGSVTSHTAIIARSMQLPAVVGIPAELTETLTADDKVIIDGYSGKLIVNPDERTEEAYRLRAKAAGKLITQLAREKSLNSETTDGFCCQLAVNLDSMEKLDEVKQTGAEGIGLFRTEFLFMNRTELPDEDEQVDVYKKLLVASGDASVIVRTLDVGGDKYDSVIYRNNEQNPFLGLRGIRLCLHERPDLFRTQLRALLRAGVYGNLYVMIPMVSSVREVVTTRELIAELQAELKAEGKEFVSRLNFGIMVETPAAAIMADRIAPLVDFFSIGTNDLLQYTMAIDRSNERVAYLYRPSHPAILELIRQVVAAAQKHNIFVSVCGQMAADPFLVPLLLGLGVNELSVPPAAVPIIRRTIRSLAMSEAEEMTRQALLCSNASDSLELSSQLLKKSAPEIAGMQIGVSD